MAVVDRGVGGAIAVGECGLLDARAGFAGFLFFLSGGGGSLSGAA